MSLPSMFLQPLMDTITSWCNLQWAFKIGISRYSSLTVDLEDPQVVVWGLMPDITLIQQCDHPVMERWVKELHLPVAFMPDGEGMYADMDTPDVNPFRDEQERFFQTLLEMTTDDVCLLFYDKCGPGHARQVPEFYVTQAEGPGGSKYFRISPIPPDDLPEFHIHGTVQ